MKKKLKKLTLLHSNDLHGDFLAEKVDDKLIGGVSRLSGYVNKVHRYASFQLTLHQRDRWDARDVHRYTDRGSAEEH